MAPTIGHGLPVPAMAPLREPELRPIVAGETWEKVASGKNSGFRPVALVSSFDGRFVTYVIYGESSEDIRQTERTFRRDWR